MRRRSKGAAPPAFYVEFFELAVGTTVEFRTDTCSSGVDPVFHLLRQTASGVTQVAFSDDYSGVHPRILFTSSSSDDLFILVMRSKTVNGSCHIKKWGALHHSAAPAGNVTFAASALQHSSGNQLRTAHVPGGSLVHAVGRFNSSSATTLVDLKLGNSTAASALTTVAATEFVFLVGTPHIRDEAGFTPARSGALRVYTNDHTNDADGDGIGMALELELQLCPTVSGCPNTYHGKDTDRDGLFDGEEVFGVAGTLANGVDDMPFQRWGANPGKKDIFLEVDYLTTMDHTATMEPGDNPFQYIRDFEEFADGGWPEPGLPGTLEQWVETAREPFLAGPAAHLKAPASVGGGVELHLDLGVPPVTPTDENKFGSWSTGAARAIVPDMIVVVSGPVNGNITVWVDGESIIFNATGLSPFYICYTMAYLMLAEFPQVAFKSLTVESSGTTTLIMEAAQEGVHFEWDIGLPHSSFWAVVDKESEGDDSLRLHYDLDPGQVDIVRRGRLRYGIVTSWGTGGQAGGVRYVAGLQHGAFIHELGHTLTLQHWVHDALGNHSTGQYEASTECLPHYQSLMRYGFGPYRFENIDGTLTLNPASVQEATTFGATFNHNIFHPSPYFYPAPPSTTTAIDWNRDGAISAAGETWRSIALSLQLGSCKAFTDGIQNIAPDTGLRGAPDLTRAYSRLYLFWSTGTAIKYVYATLGSVGQKSCTGPSNPMTGHCLTWSAPATAVSETSVVGVTAYFFGSHLYLAYNTNAVAPPSPGGQLRVRKFVVEPGGSLTLSASNNFSTSTADRRVRGTPELTLWHELGTGGELAVLYLAESNTFRRRILGPTGIWSSDVALIDTNLVAITGAQPPVAKPWPDPSFGGASGGWTQADRRTVAVLPSEAGNLRVSVLNAAGRWEEKNLGFEQGFNPQVLSKPFLEYRIKRRSNGAMEDTYGGHFMLGWTVAEGSGFMNYVRLSRYVDKTASVDLVGLAFPFNVYDHLMNQWAFNQSAETSAGLYSDATIDNVFGLWPASGSGVKFLPHADAAPNRVLTVQSDFRVMEDGICQWLMEKRSPGSDCGEFEITD
ncbi:MAG: hypothetical protein IT436_17075 [Phycisphaerales bacterium]|nr:hypothetical protein [Phycisphaerales bacterium]